MNHEEPRRPTSKIISVALCLALPVAAAAESLGRALPSGGFSGFSVPAGRLASHQLEIQKILERHFGKPGLSAPAALHGLSLIPSSPASDFLAEAAAAGPRETRAYLGGSGFSPDAVDRIVEAVARIGEAKNDPEVAKRVGLLLERAKANFAARAADESVEAVPISAVSSPLGAPSHAAPAPQNVPAPAALQAAQKGRFDRWGWKVALGTGIVYALDFATKSYAAHHLFNLFHEASWRRPLMLGVVPFVAGLALYTRSKLARDHKNIAWSIKKWNNGRLGFYMEPIAGVDTMIKTHPSLAHAVAAHDLGMALMFGGLLGNGIDLLRAGGALDWIPVGRSLLNFADVALLAGLSYFQISSQFFNEAGSAYKSGKAFRFSLLSYLGLPIAGFFAAWAVGTVSTPEPLSITLKNIGFLYLLGFSMLIGVVRFAAAWFMDRQAARFAEEAAAKKP